MSSQSKRMKHTYNLLSNRVKYAFEFQIFKEIIHSTIHNNDSAKIGIKTKFTHSRPLQLRKKHVSAKFKRNRRGSTEIRIPNRSSSSCKNTKQVSHTHKKILLHVFQQSTTKSMYGRISISNLSN